VSRAVVLMLALAACGEDPCEGWGDRFRALWLRCPPCDFEGGLKCRSTPDRDACLEPARELWAQCAPEGSELP
jgi:hypothetical protein